MKFRGGELKYLLKRATADVLPASVAQRKDKMGFPVPLHLWAKGARATSSPTSCCRRRPGRGDYSNREVETTARRGGGVRSPPVGLTQSRAVVPRVH